MLIVGLCVGLSAVCALLVTAAASQLRQRNVAPLEVEASATATQPLTGTVHGSGAPATDSRGNWEVLALLGSVLVVGTAAWYLFGTQQVRQPVCSSAPVSVAERLAHARQLRGFNHAIFTQSRDAQELFNLGLVEAWNFNQIEAQRAFEAALTADSACSRCWWGMAYALGPGANRAVLAAPTLFPSFSPADFPATRDAAQKALGFAMAAAAAHPGNPVAQRDLEYAEAIAARFPEGSALGTARDRAEEEHAVAIAALGRKHNDPDAMAMAAESFMNLSPWDYYLQDGRMRPSAVKAEALIEEALAIKPAHPLAIHLYIHIAEASDPRRSANVTASRAERFAETLTSQRGPWDTMGHLLHMPSHTFQRIGRYHDGVIANVKAFEADLDDSRHCRVPYCQEHNTDMLINNALMGGESEVAMAWSRRLATYPTLLPTGAYGDDSADWTHLPLVQTAFARWSDVLATPPPPPTARGNCPAAWAADYAQAVWHYIRVLALAATGAGGTDAKTRSEVAAELGGLTASAAKVPQEEATHPGEFPGIYACDVRKLLDIYELTARARLAALDGDLGKAQALLESAVTVEDDMGYMEPPRQYQPVRHCLGRVLLSAGRPAEAEQVYRMDLDLHPDNGWALRGLSDALAAQGRSEEARRVERTQLAAAWQHADVKLTSSCPQFGKF